MAVRTLLAGLLAFLWLPFTTTADTAGLRRAGRTLLWGDQPIQLVGYSYYGLLGDREFDGEAFLEVVAAHNLNFTRFFLILPWPVEPGPNLLPFVKVEGKYDLRRFNEEYFTRLRRLVKRAEELGIICQICLFDRCGLATSDHGAWPNNPYNAKANVNGLLSGEGRDYPAFCQTSGAIAEYNAAFIKRVVESVGDCRNVIYEIMNEPYPQLGPLAEWHSWVAGQLRENLAGRPGSQVISSCGFYGNEQIDLFSMHRAGDPSRVEAAVREARARNRPIILSDDGDAACMYDPAVTLASARRALRLGQHFEHLEFILTRQRELEHRSANGLHQISARCQLNLRNLATLSKPCLDRPYLQPLTLERSATGWVLSGQVQNAGRPREVIGQYSENGGRSWMSMPVARNGNRVRSQPLPWHAKGRHLARLVTVDQHGQRWPGPALFYGATNEWSIELGDPLVETGLMRIRPNRPDGVLRPVHFSGQTGSAADLARRGKYVYFRLDSTFIRSSQSQPVLITADFFDQVAGARVLLEYDGIPGAYSPASTEPQAGTKTWKQVTFKIPDARFQGRQNDGADLRFSLTGAKAGLILQRVRVRAKKLSRRAAATSAR